MKEILIIGAIALSVFGCRRHIVDVRSTRAKMEAIAKAIDTFEVDRDHLPKTLNELLPVDPNWQGTSGYVREAALFVDDWGTKCQYTSQANQYELRSAGPDRIFGNADDIVIETGTPNQAAHDTAPKVAEPGR